MTIGAVNEGNPTSGYSQKGAQHSKDFDANMESNLDARLDSAEPAGLEPLNKSESPPTIRSADGLALASETHQSPHQIEKDAAASSTTSTPPSEIASNGLNLDPNDAAAIKAEIASLSIKVDDFLAEKAAFSREAFAALKAELMEYKSNFFREIENDILSDFVALFHQTQQLSNYYREPRSLAATTTIEELRNTFVRNYNALSTQIEEILRRKDVERCQTAEFYDVQMQKAVEMIETPNPADDRKIVRVVKAGFTRDGKRFKKEEVAIFKYKK